MEGRKTPRRKPGRPRKPKPTEVEVEFLITEDVLKANEGQSIPEDIVDPEQVRITSQLVFYKVNNRRICFYRYHLFMSQLVSLRSCT